MAVVDTIAKKFQEYLGVQPTSAQVGQFSMRSNAEMEDILKNTRSDVQSNATKEAQKNIAELGASLKAAGVNLPYGNDYYDTIAKGKQAVEDFYGVTEARQRADEAEKFYQSIAERGPMFADVMKANLSEASPSFLGATRQDVEKFYANIPNPLVRDQMVGAFMDAKKRGVAATLDALNGLYQTAITSAKGAVDFEQKRYNTIADKAQDLYKEIQWASRESLQDIQRDSGTTVTGPTPAQITSTVNAIAGAFDNEQIVKNYNTATEGYNTLQSIGVDTVNPADDIAFIYAFAKIMDPNSVVREGEYNTIQKYSQSWADTFGFNAKRVFSNTNFLSADAKQKMLNALKPKVQTITAQYDNLYSEYQRQIDDAYKGTPRTLQQYKVPTPSSEPSSTVQEDGPAYTPGEVIIAEGFMWLVGPDGQTVTQIGTAR